MLNSALHTFPPETRREPPTVADYRRTCSRAARRPMTSAAMNAMHATTAQTGEQSNKHGQHSSDSDPCWAMILVDGGCANVGPNQRVSSEVAKNAQKLDRTPNSSTNAWMTSHFLHRDSRLELGLRRSSHSQRKRRRRRRREEQAHTKLDNSTAHADHPKTTTRTNFASRRVLSHHRS